MQPFMITNKENYDDNTRRLSIIVLEIRVILEISHTHFACYLNNAK